MPPSPQNLFSLDIEEDHHQNLLERGNLLPKKKEWTGENQWASLGYLARVLVQSCSCGTDVEIFQGVFHSERTPSGTVRNTALIGNWQVPLGQDYPIITHTESVKICAYCLPSKGFKAQP